MIHFFEFYSTLGTLIEINRRLAIMIDMELAFMQELDDDYITYFFPTHLCRESPEKCKNVLRDLQEWSVDKYLHSMTCLHEYALYQIINSYSDAMDDIEESGTGLRFSIETSEEFTEDELELLNGLQSGDDFVDTLFWDIDFTFLDEIVILYQINSPAFHYLGVNLAYYKELLPKDIREQIEPSLTQDEIDDSIESDIVNKLNDILKRLSIRPRQLLKLSEEEISDSIADMLRIASQDYFQVEREVPAGYAAKITGQTNFFITKTKDGIRDYIAIGENKFWGTKKFRSQINQLIAYLNEYFYFGFTITIIQNEERLVVIEKQQEILRDFVINGEFKAQNISIENDILISLHKNPENGKNFRIYHLILNLCHKTRELSAQKK